MNKDWTRWIVASVRKQFAQYAKDGGYFLFLEGQQRDNDNNDPAHAEFRYNGPFVRQLSRTDWYLEINISIFISVTLTNDLDLLSKIVGVFQSAFTTSIIVYKYGDNLDTDDASVLGCLHIIDQGDDTVLTNNFGQRGPDERLLQSEVVAAYKMNLSTP